MKFQSFANINYHPITYWLTGGGEFPLLRDVALKIFSCSSSVVGAKRSFSVMGNIQPKLRNRLSKEKDE